MCLRHSGDGDGWGGHRVSPWASLPMVFPGHFSFGFEMLILWKLIEFIYICFGKVMLRIGPHSVPKKGPKRDPKRSPKRDPKSAPKRGPKREGPKRQKTLFYCCFGSHWYPQTAPKTEPKRVPKMDPKMIPKGVPKRVPFGSPEAQARVSAFQSQITIYLMDFLSMSISKSKRFISRV